MIAVVVTVNVVNVPHFPPVGIESVSAIALLSERAGPYDQEKEREASSNRRLGCFTRFRSLNARLKSLLRI
jgi:hypothetical protein